MSLDQKYDQFYHRLKRGKISNGVSASGWPVNRHEAITFVAGSGRSILDIGCGEGDLLLRFKDRYAELIGLEYSEKRLLRARQHLAGLNFQAIRGSAESLESIETDSIDRVVSADTVEHIPDIYLSVGEMYRVLKPGGDLIINTPNIAFIKKRLLLFFGYFPSTSQPNEGLGSDILFDGGHFHYFTFRSLSLLLERSGFQVAIRMGYGPYGRLHNVWPALLSGGVQLVAVKPE